MRTPDLDSLLKESLDTLEEILLTHSQLIETLLDQTQTRTSQDRIEDLRRKIDLEREKLQKSRDSQRRRKELERIRKDQDKDQTEKAKQNESKGSASTFPLLNGKGKVVGFIQQLGKNRLNILNSKGVVVAREIQGLTFDGQGRFQGRGSQGLRVLGMTQRN